MCDAQDITIQKNLLNTSHEQLMKFIVFVPESHVEQIRNALSDSGAGHIGAYSHCTFQSSGQGTFKPLEGTKPYIGTQNELSITQEMKIETIVTSYQIEQVTEAVYQAHTHRDV